IIFLKLICKLNMKLIKAIKTHQDIHFIKQIVNDDNINYKNKYGHTALQCASNNGDLNLIKFLIEKGADINGETNTTEENSLMIASRLGHLEIVKFLIEK